MNRDAAFADTFRAVGQVMHLIADSGVPAHVRNDIHIFPLLSQSDRSWPQIGNWTYETWCKYNIDKLTLNAASVDLDITKRSHVPDLVPITNFWDTTPAGGDNPAPAGLAEYTNRNFLSEDTIFKVYDYPKSTGLYLDKVVAEDGKTEYLFYFKGLTTDNRTIDHLAATGYLWMELIEAWPYEVDDSRFKLDDNCYADYAAILVPKAASYAAGLLDYFFRGQIDIQPDPANPRQFIIHNDSDEEMAGTFTLYADDELGTRSPVTAEPWVLQIPAHGTSAPVTFAWPESFKEESLGSFTLVFRGTLGDEHGAVVPLSSRST
jgi:hypothetical protein